MSIIVSFVLMAAFSYFAVKPVKKFAVVFYVIAILISIFGIYFTWNPTNSDILRTITYAIQKGHLGFSLLIVVMFIGVFAQDSIIRRRLTPVRAELSIIGSILIVGHFIPYLMGYLGIIGNLLNMRVSILISLLISVVILVLLVLLAVTSFNFVKKRMSKKAWIGIQRLAYVFFGLVFCHLFGFLIVPASAGDVTAQINLAFYGIVLVSYVSLRIRRAILDKAAANTKQED